MLSLRIFDAAQSVGQGSYSDLTNPAAIGIWGAVTATDTSWGPEGLAFGQAGAVTQSWSNGFVTQLRFTYAGPDTYVVDHVELHFAGTILWTADGNISFSGSTPAMLSGAALFSGDDLITGSAADNVLQGWSGNDTIDGGSGIDTLVLECNRADAIVTISGAAAQVRSPDGSDSMFGIERLHFADGSVALDLQGNAGEAYRLYRAALGREPDLAGLGFQMHALDTGFPLVQVAQNFIDSPEFRQKYGSLDTAGFVTQLYANVLHRSPDAGGLQFYLDWFDHGATRADVLQGFSESPENQANVIGSIAAGINYIEWS